MAKEPEPGAFPGETLRSACLHRPGCEPCARTGCGVAASLGRRDPHAVQLLASAFFSFHSMLLWPLRPGPSGHLLGQSCPHPSPTLSRTRQQLDTAPSSPHSGPGLSPPGCSGPSMVHTVPFVKTLPLVSQGDGQNLDKRVGPTRRTARPVSVTWSRVYVRKDSPLPKSIEPSVGLFW